MEWVMGIAMAVLVIILLLVGSFLVSEQNHKIKELEQQMKALGVVRNTASGYHILGEDPYRIDGGLVEKVANKVAKHILDTAGYELIEEQIQSNPVIRKKRPVSKKKEKK